MPTKTQQGARAPLDVNAIVAFFGGYKELARAFEKHGITELTPDAVQQWKKRKHIPFGRRIDLQLLAKAQKRPFRLSRYRRSKSKKVGT